jgi:hypothetical protein
MYVNGNLSKNGNLSENGNLCKMVIELKWQFK